MPSKRERRKRLIELNSAMLFSYPNVRSIGIGYVTIKGKRTNELGIIVGLTQKLPRGQLKERDVIPRILSLESSMSESTPNGSGEVKADENETKV